MVFNPSEELRRLQESPVLTRSHFSTKFDKSWNKFDKGWNKLDRSWNSLNNNYKSDWNLSNKLDNYTTDNWKCDRYKYNDWKLDRYDNYKSDLLKNERWKSEYNNDHWRCNNFKSEWRNENFDDNLFELPNYLKSVDVYNSSPLKNNYTSPLKYHTNSPRRYSFSSPLKTNYTTNRIKNYSTLRNHSVFNNTSPVRCCRPLDTSDGFYTPNRNFGVYDSKLRRIKENLNSLNFNNNAGFDDLNTFESNLSRRNSTYTINSNPGRLSGGVGMADIDELYNKAKELKYKLLTLKQN